MSQKAEISAKPQPPIPPPLPPAAEDPNPNRSATAKRPRDDSDAAASSATAKRPRDDSDAAASCAGDLPPRKRLSQQQDVLFRIIVPSRQIGKVIGKEGTRIQKIREETKATIKIAAAIARHEERVIIISSKDNENVYSDAEIALHQIANVVLKDDQGNNNEPSNVGTGHVAANAIRLLIAGSQAGGLIGVSGQNIEKLRNSSGATITVLAQNQLPLCASAYESDRVVQVSGEVPAVLKALIDIGCQLRENPPKQVISFSPTYNLGTHQPPQQYVDPNSAEYVTLVMMISESMVGGLIGRCGSNISRIRTESGATIKVHGGKGEQKLRQIHLGGNAVQVALAKRRVDEYIYSQMIQQAGGEQIPTQEIGLIPTYAQNFIETTTNQAPAYYGPSSHAPPI